MMISNIEKPFGLYGLHTYISALQGLNLHEIRGALRSIRPLHIADDAATSGGCLRVDEVRES